MIGFAFRDYLQQAGVVPARYGEFGDYVRGQASFLVYASTDGGEGVYEAALMVKARAGDAVAAERECGRARDAVLAARYSTLRYTPPGAGQTQRVFHVQYIREDQRPTWFPTAEQGEQASSNFTVFVREP